jgi:hypothetical protein
MPWDSTLSDYLYQKGRAKAQDRNDAFSKLMSVATLGKSIWDTTQQHKWQQESLAPGSPEEQALIRGETRTEATWQAHNNAEQDIWEKRNTAQNEYDASVRSGDRQAAIDAAKLLREFDAEQNRLTRESAIQEAKIRAGYDLKKDKQASVSGAWDKAYATVTDQLVEDGVFPGWGAVDKNLAKQLFDAAMTSQATAYGVDDATRDSLIQSFNDMITRTPAAKIVPPPGTVNPPGFNPPTVKPANTAVQDVASLAKKLVEARKKAAGDPQAKATLDYIQGQLPRPGNVGGPDYQRNPAQWIIDAYAAINKILGVQEPSTSGSVPRQYKPKG